MPRARKPQVIVKPRIRVVRGSEIALGPGKVELLRSIGSAGSLAAAARALGMSYMRAWKLVQTMNACFRRPLVELERGGASQGGAELTAFGLRALALYDAMEAKSRAAIDKDWRALRRLLAISR